MTSINDTIINAGGNANGRSGARLIASVIMHVLALTIAVGLVYGATAHRFWLDVLPTNCWTSANATCAQFILTIAQFPFWMGLGVAAAALVAIVAIKAIANLIHNQAGNLAWEDTKLTTAKLAGPIAIAAWIVAALAFGWSLLWTLFYSWFWGPVLITDGARAMWEVMGQFMGMGWSIPIMLIGAAVAAAFSGLIFVLTRNGAPGA